MWMYLATRLGRAAEMFIGGLISFSEKGVVVRGEPEAVDDGFGTWQLQSWLPRSA